MNSYDQALKVFDKEFEGFLDIVEQGRKETKVLDELRKARLAIELAEERAKLRKKVILQSKSNPYFLEELKAVIIKLDLWDK